MRQSRPTGIPVGNPTLDAAMPKPDPPI